MSDGAGIEPGKRWARHDIINLSKICNCYMEYTEFRSQISEQEFKEVVARFEQSRGTRDYYEMIKDIQMILRDWEDAFSEELRSEVYPAWKRGDFRRLLSQLGEEEWENVMETERKSDTEDESVKERHERQERVAEAMKKDAKARKEVERDFLRTKLKQAKQSLSLHGEYSSREEQVKNLLAQDEADLHQMSNELKNMGWIGRLKNRARTKVIKDAINTLLQRIQELKKEIASAPSDKDRVEEAKRKASHKKRSQELTDEIEELERQLATMGKD